MSGFQLHYHSPKVYPSDVLLHEIHFIQTNSNNIISIDEKSDFADDTVRKIRLKSRICNCCCLFGKRDLCNLCRSFHNVENVLIRPYFCPFLGEVRAV